MKALLRFAINVLPYAATAAWYFTWGQALHWQAVLWLWAIVFITDLLAYGVGFARARNIGMQMFKEMYERGHINPSFIKDKMAQKK